MFEEFKFKGEVSEHKKLRAVFPEGLFQVMKVQGLGTKRTAILFKTLKIDSLEKLANAAHSGDIAKLRGFGDKVQENILANLEFVEKSSQRNLLVKALSYAGDVRRYLSPHPSIQNLETAGSLRRWKETIGDIDFLCTSQNPEKAISHFLTFPDVEKVLAHGPTKASVLLKNGPQCDFRVVEPGQFGAAMVYFTGSKEHNVRLRELALRKGLTLNEYGLFKLTDKNKEKPVAAKTEEDVYRYLGLPWIPPELREDRGEIEMGLKNKLPRLIEEADILGDVHNHTTLSDGKNTAEEMIRAAENLKWDWYFCGDHSPSLAMTHGLAPAALWKKRAHLEDLQSKFKKIKIFLGSEVDILPNGNLDYENAVLEKIDCVVASIHSRFKQTEGEMTARICRAIENPHVDILGHITGRLMNTRPGYNVDFEAILQKAKETQTAIEINGQPDRLELSDTHVKRAVELGVPIVLSTDAHSISHFENMVYALHVARRGWATAKDILNTRSTTEILEWLQS